MNDLDATFSALAHPIRRAILERLATGEATVNDLAEPFQMSLPAVSRHLKVLEKAKLISRGQNAQFRPCQLNLGPIEDAVSWTARCRQLWTHRLDKMETLIAQSKEERNGE